MKDENKIRFCDTEKRIVVIFGDINGFRTWIKRSGRDNLKNTFIEIAEQWKAFRERADLFKTLGDGFIAVYEIDGRTGGKTAACLIQKALACYSSTEDIIDDSLNPRPEGFRIRIAEGDGLKYIESFNGKKTHDYISYYINMSRELLQIKEEVPVIVHGNFKELLNGRSRKIGIQFKPIARPRIDRTDIFHEDLENLWRVEKRKRKKSRRR